MYTSRPRYGRYSSELNIPENYSGNAFRQDATRSEPEEIPAQTADAHDDEAKEATEVFSEVTEGEENRTERSPRKRKGTGFGLDIGKLFGGGIGSEELLIVALILLMAQGDGNDDMILLLALLLFVK